MRPLKLLTVIIFRVRWEYGKLFGIKVALYTIVKFESSIKSLQRCIKGVRGKSGKKPKEYKLFPKHLILEKIIFSNRNTDYREETFIIMTNN